MTHPKEPEGMSEQDDDFDLPDLVPGTYVRIDDDDPAAFWRALTPAQARALLAAAPRVVSEWRNEDAASNLSSVRVDTAGEIVARVSPSFRDRTLWHAVTWTPKGTEEGMLRADFATADEARRAATGALLASGWLLDDTSEAGT